MSDIIAKQDEVTPKLTATPAANVAAVSTGALILLSDVITALGTLQASHNDLLAKLKAAGLMVPD